MSPSYKKNVEDSTTNSAQLNKKEPGTPIRLKLLGWILREKVQTKHIDDYIEAKRCIKIKEVTKVYLNATGSAVDKDV